MAWNGRLGRGGEGVFKGGKGGKGPTKIQLNLEGRVSVQLLSSYFLL